MSDYNTDPKVKQALLDIVDTMRQLNNYVGELEERIARLENPKAILKLRGINDAPSA